MTRPIDQARQFIEAMPQDLHDQIQPIFSPLLTIEPIGAQTIMDVDEAAVFSSANGVRYGPEGAARPAYCIGAATTALARTRGWNAVLAGQDAEALVNTLAAHPPLHPLVHIRGRHTRGSIADRLSSAGLRIRSQIVYEQHAQSLSSEARAALSREQITLVPLFSPRTAAQFAKEAPRTTSLRVVALSAAVAQAASPLTVAMIADSPDGNAMYVALQAALGAG